jgi:ABC-type phosphate/phosphonate transport system substrate-binding protein
MLALRFAVTASRDSGDAFDELRDEIARADGPAVSPLFVPDYKSLHEAMHLQLADVAWCPPLVARDLLRVGAGDPIATVERGGRDAHYSAIIVRRDSEIGGDLGTARFGWVSRLSAAGYIVPRRHLASLGVSFARATETFHRSHDELARALIARQVDVIGTYASKGAHGYVLPARLREQRIFATAGPIPGDVIVYGRRGAPELSRSLGAALQRVRLAPHGPLANLLDASGFGPVGFHHFDALARWFD